MARQIRRVAVLGSGVMGSGIAAHLANAGIESLLFDIVPSGAPADDRAARTAIAAGAVAKLPKAKPPALFNKAAASLITPCNYDDDADKLASCDWIVEVVVERLDIKHKVYQWVADNRAPGSIVSSNTSGIPLALLTRGMADEMKQNFLITHFFNPVRWLRLLELVTGPDTDPAVASQLAEFGRERLGKGIVWGKDTPAFVANRVGTYGMGSVFHYMGELGMTVEEVDAVFGKAMGRAKSAVFRTGDVVGLDTLVHVMNGLYEACPEDPGRERFKVPSYLQALVDDGRLGQKSGAGFYKKVKSGGKSEILALDLNTLEYRSSEKVRFASIGAARKIDDLGKAVKTIVNGDDNAARLAWKVMADTMAYAASHIPEIADDVVNVDNGMKWGFGWEQGPFESWDALGVAETVERMEQDGFAVAQWVKDMLAAGRESFYARDESGQMTFWGIDGAAHPVPRSDAQLFLAEIKLDKSKVIKRNAGASLVDLGDGVLGLEFHTKMNALDNLIFDQYALALDKLDEGEFDALVVGNQGGQAFCAGANLLMILMGAMQKEWGQIEGAIKQMQDLLMRAKYSDKPVVTAPYGLTLGGGVEVAMQSSATVSSGDVFMGLVEVGMGLIPGGGGCKEVMVRYLGDVPQDIDYDPNPFLQKAFERIAMAKVTSSAGEAMDWGYLRPTDRITMDPDALIADAKKLALGLVASGYKAPRQRSIKVPGAGSKAAISLFAYQMHEGGYITDHDTTVANKLAHVLTGGDVPAGTVRTEQDLLDLEREVFLSLCGEEKTLARIQHFLQTGKPLRN